MCLFCFCNHMLFILIYMNLILIVVFMYLIALHISVTNINLGFNKRPNKIYSNKIMYYWNCCHSIRIFIIVYSLIFLLRSAKLTNSQNVDFSGSLALDQMYAIYLICPDEEFPIDSRRLLKRWIQINSMNKVIVESLGKINNLVAMIMDDKKGTDEIMGNGGKGKGKVGEKKKETVGKRSVMQAGGRLIAHLKKLRKKLRESIEKLNREDIDDTDVCYTLALQRHVKRLAAVVGRADGQEGSIMAKMDKLGQFGDEENCDRLEEIQNGVNARDEDREWLYSVVKELAQSQYFILGKLLRGDEQNMAKRKAVELFDRQKASWENELTHALRLRAFLDAGDLAKLVPERVLQLVERDEQLQADLFKSNPTLLSGFDLIDWFQPFYIKYFTTDSKLAEEKHILSVELMLELIYVDELHRQKGRPACDWAEIRQNYARHVDELDANDDDYVILYNSDFEIDKEKRIDELVTLYEARKKLEQYIRRPDWEWNFSEILEELKNGQEEGHRKERSTFATMRHDQEELHLKLIEMMVSEKQKFRWILQEQSGAELIKRMFFLIGKRHLSAIGHIIRFCLSKEGAPEWLQSTALPSTSFDECPGRDPDEITESYHDILALDLVDYYTEHFQNSELNPNENLIGRKVAMISPIRLQRNPDAMWLVNSLVDELLYYADQLIVMGPEGSVDLKVNYLWTEWAQIVVEDIEEKQGFGVRLCRRFRFAMLTIHKLWEKLDEVHRVCLRELLRGARWTDINIIATKLPFSEHEDVKEQKQQIPACDDDDEVDAFVGKMSLARNMERIHTLTLFRLIKRSKHFQHFLCHKLENAVQMEQTKHRMLPFIGMPSEMQWLEEMFPEILRIDQMNYYVRTMLYGQMLVNRNGSAESIQAESRMVVPLLLQQFNAHMAGKSNVNILDYDLLIETLRDEVYPNVDTVSGVCWMMYLLKHVGSEWGAERQFVQPSEEMIAQCVAEWTRLPELQNMSEGVRQQHWQFLLSRDREHTKPLAMVMPPREPGARARLWKLLGDIHYKDLWEQQRQNIRNFEMFDDDQLLAKHYLGYLFGSVDTVLDNIAHKLAADLTVFVRWFDAAPKGAPGLARFWNEAKECELELACSFLFDFQSIQDLCKSGWEFFAMFKGLREFLKANQNVGFKNKLKEEWREARKRGIAEAEARIVAMGELMMPRMAGWVLELHAETIRGLLFGEAEEPEKRRKMIKKSAWFGKEFKKGLEESLYGRKRLFDFLELDTLRDIFEEIGVLYNAEDFEDLKNLKEKEGKSIIGLEEEEPKKKVKKKKKAKKKKAENGEIVQENGEQERVREVGENGEMVEEPIEETYRDNEIVVSEESEESGKSKNTISKEMKKKRKENRRMRKMERIAEKMVKNKNKNDENPDCDEKSSEDMMIMQSVTIADLKDDQFLLQKYVELLSDPFNMPNANRRILDLSAFANEIWHRISTFRLVQNRVGIVLFHEKIMEKWEIIGQKQITTEQTEIDKLVQELYGLVEGLIVGKDTESRVDTVTQGDNAEDRRTNVAILKEQLHKNKFARMMLANAQLEKAWAKLTADGQKQAITVISGREGENRKSKEQKRKEFMRYIERWAQTEQQIKMDERIFNEFKEKGYLKSGSLQASTVILERFCVENLQQIKFPSETSADDDEATLDKLLAEQGFDGIEETVECQIRQQFEEIRRIVEEWSKGRAKLLLGGSHMLKVFTAHSDLDTLCIAPEHIQPEHFFGTQRCNSAQGKHRCDGQELFCLLAKHPMVQSLQRIPTAWVPLIKISLRSGLELDIVFASIPGQKSIKIDDLDNETMIDQYLHNFAKKMDDGSVADELAKSKEEKWHRMMRSLAGYHSNLKMLKLIPNIGTFRKLVLALKLWAKNNFIYNNMLGFLNGISLCVMAVKLMLLYPEARQPFLLERFFFIYLSWEWPMPVQLSDISPDDPHSWSPERELQKRETQFGTGQYAQMTMPVIAPGYPEQNTTFNINWYSAKVIRKTMREALETLHTLTKSPREKWTKLLQPRRFSDMYRHFFTIVCAASDEELNAEFCGFVSTRIRVQLLTSSECVRSGIEFCHARVMTKCPGHVVHKYKRISARAVCKCWLVGVQPSGYHPSPEGTMLIDEANLREELTEQIVDSYKKLVLGMGRTAGGSRGTMIGSPSQNGNTARIRKYFNKIAGERGAGWDVEGREFVHLEPIIVTREELIRTWPEQ